VKAPLSRVATRRREKEGNPWKLSYYGYKLQQLTNDKFCGSDKKKQRQFATPSKRIRKLLNSNSLVTPFCDAEQRNSLRDFARD